LQKEKINIKPKKALIFSNYIKKDHVIDIINTACTYFNIELDIAGENSGNSIMYPEKILGNYDIVFGKAKAGIEALSTGACLIVCDFTGLGGMVLPENMSHYRDYNFGMKLMTNPITVNLLIDEIKKYDQNKILEVSNYIREKSNLKTVIKKLEELYLQSVAEFASSPIGKYKYSIFNHIYILYLNRYFTIKVFFLKLKDRFSKKYQSSD
jgi:hypothetical protein